MIFQTKDPIGTVTSEKSEYPVFSRWALCDRGGIESTRLMIGRVAGGKVRTTSSCKTYGLPEFIAW